MAKWQEQLLRKMAKAKLELMQGNADIDQSKADFNSMMREADGLLEENEVEGAGMAIHKQKNNGKNFAPGYNSSL